MPPKARITKEMIIDAAFEIARECGADRINARSVSARLACSTQPVMYHFKTIDELKKAVYCKADEYHSAYISNVQTDEPMRDIGLNYIRFSIEERKLFRFLFQSNKFTGGSIFDLIDAEELRPVIALFAEEAGLSLEQARIAFRSVFLCVHGYASMFANNDMQFDEQSISANLAMILYGSVCALKEGVN